MATHPQRFKLSRIPGLSLFRFESLWLEQDHLIVSTGYGILMPFVETYRRFFFRDIEGIQISGNQRHHTTTITLAILTVLALGAFLLAGWIGNDLLGLAVFFFVAVIGLLLALVINIFKGPACRVHLKTAVQAIPLKSVTRLAQAGVLLARLRPLIEEAQADLPAVSLTEAPVAPPLREAAVISVPAAVVPPAPSGKETPLFWHWLTGGLLLSYAILSLTDYFIQHLWPSLTGLLVAVALLLTPVVALIRQSQSGSSARLAVVSWAGTVFSLFILVSGYVALIHIQLKHPSMMGNQWEMLKFYAGQAPGQDPVQTVMTALDVILGSCGGILYLGVTFQEKRRQTRRKASPVL